MPEYLLDTNVLSETRKRQPHGAVLAWLAKASPELIFTSVVTLGELQHAIEKTRSQDPTKATDIEKWLDQVAATSQVLPMDTACFREWARFMIGRSYDLMQDAMIAATARVHNLTVVTRNERDFRHFGVKVLNPFLHK